MKNETSKEISKKANRKITSQTSSPTTRKPSKKTSRRRKGTKAQIGFKRKLNLYSSRFSIFLKISVIALLLIFFFTDVFYKQKDFIREEFYNITANYGFTLDNIIVEGQENLPFKEILQAIGAKKKDPIFSIDISQVKKSLNNNKWTTQALVERRLPNTLYIALEERKPIAIWQFGKKHYLIDEDGERIIQYKRDHSASQSGLLLVVGSGANIYANHLLKELEKAQKLSEKIIAATRYGGRRWDLILEEQIKVKMPEDHFFVAYDYLNKLDKKGKLFGNNNKEFDLRNTEQYAVLKNKNR
jgi:cell division protein FtsQ